jgi:hypothetical protein
MRPRTVSEVNTMLSGVSLCLHRATELRSCPSALKNIGGVYLQDNVASSLSARRNRFLERRVRPPHACACVSFAHVCLVIIELSGDCGHTPLNPRMLHGGAP